MEPLLFTLVLFLSFTPVIPRFLHFVNPSCPEEAKECEFDFDISYMETMVYYQRDQKWAVPVVYREGKFYKRQSYSCETLTPLSDDEMTQIVTGDGSYKMIFAINEQFPGTPIIVYEGQTVVVNVHNDLMNEGVSIHWHGIVQKKTPWMDGASMLTQCPINYKETFQYRFKADPRGTHWYHSHHGTQRADGIVGPLIVLPKHGDERKDLPRVDRDFIMMVQDWTRNSSSMEVNLRQYWNMGLYSDDYNSSVCYSPTHAADNTDVGSTPFHSALINGRGHYYPDNDDAADLPELPLEIFRVESDRFYKFRIINAALLFPFRVSIDDHTLEIVATDGYDVEPYAAESVIMSGGERFDVIVKADAPRGNYWIRVETLATKDIEGKRRRPGQVLGVLRYKGAPEELPKSNRRECTERRTCKVVNCPFKRYPRRENIECVPITDLKGTKDLMRRYPVPIPESPVRSERDPVNFKELFFNFHFSNDGVNPYTPAVNSHKFKYPSCPPQVTYEPGSKVCFDDCSEHDCDTWCKCTYTLQLRELDIPVQFVMVNDDDLSMGMVHAIHIHGHGVHVMKVGYAETDQDSGSIVGRNRDITCSGRNCRWPHWTDKSWTDGRVPDMNSENPPIKDTVAVPRKGYVVLRFPTDNPGYWYMHCHVETHQLEGMTVILKEGLHSEMVPPPKNFPLCGSFKWTNDEFEILLKQPRKSRKSKVGAINDFSNSTDNLESQNNTSGSPFSRHHRGRNHDDDMLHISLSKVAFVAIVLFLMLLILLLVAVIVWLYRTRNEVTERTMLQKTPHVYYGTVLPRLEFH